MFFFYDQPGRRLYTYNPEFHHSMTVVPVDEEAVRKQASEKARAAWKTTQGFTCPGKKTSIESNKHNRKPPVARIEELQKVGTR